jgi:hypothetical protein
LYRLLGMKARWLVALAALAAAGGGCGRITALEPDAGSGADGADGCEGLTESACSAHPGCVVAHPCACPGQPTSRCVSADAGVPLNCTADYFCPSSCSALAEDACAARQDCQVATCPTCGGSAFAGCIQVGGVLPQCPAPPPCPPPPPCDGLAEAACAAAQGCTPMYCGGCQGQIYVGCATGSGGHSCPAVICPAPCSTETTLAACDARADCHSVFYDPGTCGCAVSGCCAKFSRCADGATADCKGGSLACAIRTPYCEAPYVVSYAGSCYEGCVRANACAP